ncbi:TlpA family protein disulfide reductase [Clostridium cylindrosporum]|uniref:Thiol-disulfide oxidoreductase ResA n=1 Tax=Clostridium cylindrosporum DSM 605 TaxID=1121307 RepID=A0A0J8DG78_CLOCY|nr:TlpA disulfide reductase family protein [Clostridium cylindrosporum]KMT23244.1 thiol-disulfide oxidoreductase ResA [Clostridium cylindrosporum DSM 605]
MKKVILMLLIVILFGVSIYTVLNYNKNKNNSLQNPDMNNSNSSVQNYALNSADKKQNTFVKTKAIDFKLKDLNGKEVSLSTLKGKHVLINFWATWCPPCRSEMPDIEKLYQETKDSDLVILAIDIGEDKETVKSFIDENKFNFNVLLDSNKDVAIKYNITSIPTSFFIDKEGNIIYKKIGAMNIEEMKSFIKSS